MLAGPKTEEKKYGLLCVFALSVCLNNSRGLLISLPCSVFYDVFCVCLWEFLVGLHGIALFRVVLAVLMFSPEVLFSVFSPNSPRQPNSGHYVSGIIVI